MTNQDKKYANRDEFLASVTNATARELCLFIFSCQGDGSLDTFTGLVLHY